MLTEQSLMINGHRTTNQGHLMKQHEINMAPAFLRFQNGVCGSLWQFVAVKMPYFRIFAILIGIRDSLQRLTRIEQTDSQLIRWQNNR